MTPKELAAAIRRGAELIKPILSFVPCSVDAEPSGCALCALATGIYGDYESVWPAFLDRFSKGKDGSYVSYVAELAGIPREMAAEIEQKYMAAGSNDFHVVADWLDTLEPETKQDDAVAYAAFKATLFSPVPVNDSALLDAQVNKAVDLPVGHS